MKAKDRYLKFVQWSDEDQLYIGYCPDLFRGGCCHSENEASAYAELCEIVEEDVAERQAAGEALPEVTIDLRPEYMKTDLLTPQTSEASVSA